MWIDMFSFLSLLLQKIILLALCPSISLAPPHSIQSFWLPIILTHVKIYTKRQESEHHLALSSGAPMASKSEGESELWSSLFFFEALAHKVTETQRKGWRGLECGSGSGGRNVSSLFVSVCGAWWMRWVDVMTWLIAQTLNKSPILQQASPSGTPLPPSLLAASQRGRTLWLGGLEV